MHVVPWQPDDTVTHTPPPLARLQPLVASPYPPGSALKLASSTGHRSPLRGLPWLLPVLPKPPPLRSVPARSHPGFNASAGLSQPRATCSQRSTVTVREGEKKKKKELIAPSRRRAGAL